MAKRRKLVAPTPDDLTRFEEEFRRETITRPMGGAPIAQVAAESAGAYDPRPPQDRERAAKDRSDADKFRDMSGRGLVMLEIPLDEIDADALVRDRVVLDTEEMNELQMSISTNGLRLPIEVYPLNDDRRGFRYGLLSGYRRFRAVQALREISAKAEHATIRAVLRDPSEMGGTFAAMIEENEIRANLSHFERGRIAVIASQQGAFVTVETAVDGLFPMASKGKRSKIRSFALIFEELGDMLHFPEQLRERDGLKLAAALRAGAEAQLREALARRVPQTATDEAEMIVRALSQLDPVTADPSKGGRPKKTLPPKADPNANVRETRILASGVNLKSIAQTDGWSIQLQGARINAEQIDHIMQQLSDLLDQS
ncbi:chromosome partitioning protein ParB [Rhodobacteraceae bacterium]|nr:chromosome partitioning protein ParB [Paracoccaceae bacterium]